MLWRSWLILAVMLLAVGCTGKAKRAHLEETSPTSVAVAEPAATPEPSPPPSEPRPEPAPAPEPAAQPAPETQPEPKPEPQPEPKPAPAPEPATEPEVKVKETVKDPANGDAVVVRTHTIGIIGEIEPIVLLPDRIIFDARIDTGATTSSLDARNVKEFERDGKRWVRFELVHPDTGKVEKLERAVTRRVKIKDTDSDADRRYVVQMKIAMGKVVMDREFTLADRSVFEYPVLIGRNVLRGAAVVDVAKKRILKPELGPK